MDYADNNKEKTDSGQQLNPGTKEDLEKGHVTKRPQKSSQAAGSHSGNWEQIHCLYSSIFFSLISN